MQRTARFAAAILLVVAIAGTSDIQPTNAKSLKSIKKQFQQVSRNIREYQSRLRHAKHLKTYAIQNLAVAEQKHAASQARLRDIRSQLDTTRKRLESTRAKLTRIKKRLKERNDMLATRVADTYKHGSASYVSVLLGATDFSDLLSRGYIVRKILKNDSELIDAVRRDKIRVESYQAQLREQEQLRKQLEHQQAYETHVAANAAAEKERNLQRIKSQVAECEAALAEMEATSASLEAMIQRMQRTPAGRARAARAWSGGYLRPVPGGVTSSYGYRFHPILRYVKLHTGVDLRAPHGAPIKAAAGGVVIGCTYLKGYGNTVTIDHGGNVSTVYAHCSSFSVRYGQTVKQGQIIARVGSTGYSTGPHLHFEVRRNGKAVRPPF